MAQQQNTVASNTSARERAISTSDNFFDDGLLFRRMEDTLIHRDEDMVWNFIKHEYRHLPSRELNAKHLDYDRLFDWVRYGETPVKFRADDGPLKEELWVVFGTHASCTDPYAIVSRGSLRVFCQEVINAYRDLPGISLNFWDSLDKIQDFFPPGDLGLGI